MSAHQGDSSPDVFVFPPFAPPPRHPGGTPAPPAEEPAPAPESPTEPEPFGLEVPLPAHDVGEPEAQEEEVGASLPWEAEEAAGEEGGEQDLPWLELPDGGKSAAAAPAEPEVPARAEEGPSWMAWEGEASSLGSTAAEITPPPLATSGELTSVSAVPSPAAEPSGFAEPDPYAVTAEPRHPETLEAAPVEEAHSWPVEAMEPSALQAAETEPVIETGTPPEPVAAHAPAIDHAAFGRVAERLEEAARALRNDPGGFIAAHHDDPLALLVAGYALGYRQGSRRAE